MKFSGRTATMGQFSLADNLRFIKSVGFDGVELSLLNHRFDMVPDYLDQYVIAYNRDLISELGLDPVVLSCHADYIYNDVAFSFIKAAISKVQAYNTSILIISNAPKRRGLAEDGFHRLVSRTRDLVAIAEDAGVVLAQEFEPGFIVGTTAELVCLFDAIPSPSLACNLDLGHAFLCDPDPLASIAQLGEKIVHGHIENMCRGVHQHQLPDQGDMNLNTYLSALAEIGFTGGLALDIYGVDYREIAPAALAYLRRSICGV